MNSSITFSDIRFSGWNITSGSATTVRAQASTQGKLLFLRGHRTDWGEPITGLTLVMASTGKQVEIDHIVTPDQALQILSR